MIRKMHCVIAISYLINTDVLITFALRQATSTSPLECCSGAGSWMLHWNNWYNFTILCWLPSSNPHCESWSWSISSPTAGLGKSLLGSRKLRFAMPSAAPPWVIPWGWPCSNTACASSVSHKPDWRLRQRLLSASLGFRKTAGQTC